jgi:hypothetical protein
MLAWCIQYSLYFSNLFYLSSADATVPVRFPRAVEAEVLRACLVRSTSGFDSAHPQLVFVGRVLSYDPWKVEDVGRWVLLPPRSEQIEFRPFSQSQHKPGGGDWVTEIGSGKRGVRISFGRLWYDDNRATVSQFVEWGGHGLCGDGPGRQISLIRFGGTWWVVGESEWHPDK